MAVWTGPLHGVVELGCLTTLDATPQDSSSETTGLSGRRRVWSTPVESRVWACSINVSTPQDAGLLLSVSRLWRGRSVWWVTPAAAVQNVLPPMHQRLDRARGVMIPTGWTGAGLGMADPVATADGVVADAFTATGQARSITFPVVPGKPVTVSAYLTAGGTASLSWVAPGGATTPAATSPAAPGGMGRVFATATPTTQRAAVLTVDGATVIAGPQVTWTAGSVPYVPGMGAQSVRLGPVSERVVMALSDGSRNLSSYDYTVREVGA